MSEHPFVETPAGALFPKAIDLEAVRRAHKAFATEQDVRYADGNTAAAYACLQMWRMILVGGFPITPSTKWLETVSTVIRSGQVGKKKIKLLEAEHAVADYLAGSAAACRDVIVSTATSSVGLDHMTESTRSLGASGLGNVLLINVYRATANYPLCIEGDPSDALAHRDDGWVQICCRGTQQIYDTVIQSPCIGMNPEILTPVMPGYYGIKDSHRSSKLIVEPDDKINAFQDKWISPLNLPGLINGDTGLGSCVTSKHFQGFKINQRSRFERVFEWLPKIGRDFEKTFGRPGLEFIEKLHWPSDEAVDLAIVSMGPDIGTATDMVPAEEKRLGIRMGVLAARLLTPFPYGAYTDLLKRAKVVLVVNQAHHYGDGHLGTDIIKACYDLKERPVIANCFAGMGGATVSDDSWRAMIDHALQAAKKSEKLPAPVVVHEGRVVWPS